jgi:hypothetical protein
VTSFVWVTKLEEDSTTQNAINDGKDWTFRRSRLRRNNSGLYLALLHVLVYM